MFEWLQDASLERLTATISEGFCPACGQRLSQELPFPDEIDLAERTPYAQGGCSACGHWLRAGHDGGMGKDWFEATAYNGTFLTLSLNPPPDPDDEDEWDWEPEDAEF